MIAIGGDGTRQKLAVSTPETSVDFHETARRSIPGDIFELNVV
jgi:hypothetical protein